MANVARETYYTISNSNGRSGGRWADEFATQQEALDALQAEMGWDEIVESDSYTIDNGSAISCYETQEECDADQEGAYAPRVNEYEREIELPPARIRKLSNEAAEHGDLDMVAVCERALEGDADALRECERVLVEAEARSAEVAS